MTEHYALTAVTPSRLDSGRRNAIPPQYRY